MMHKTPSGNFQDLPNNLNPYFLENDLGILCNLLESSSGKSQNGWTSPR